MKMKVLKKSEDFNWSRKVKCPYCRAELLVEKDDISYNNYSDGDFWSDEEEYYSYQCPECNYSNKLGEKLIPARVKSLAYSKYLYERYKR